MLLNEGVVLGVMGVAVGLPLVAQQAQGGQAKRRRS